MKCPKCNYEQVPEEAKFCPTCGELLLEVSRLSREITMPSEEDLFFNSIIHSYFTKNLRFVRRDWLAAEVDALLADPDFRFVLLTAEPGAGKSAFMAQLAHDHPNWPRYFIRRDQRTPLGDVGIHSFMLRVGYQLAARFPELFAQEQLKIAIEQRIGIVEDKGKVVGAEVKRLLASPFYTSVLQVRQHVERNKGSVVGLRVEDLVIEPRLIDPKDLQFMALIDPALASLQREPEKQIAILVDALDEIRHQGTEGTILKWLMDCPELPRNVRFILTSRPPEGGMITFCEKKQSYIRPLTIDPEDKRVQGELKTYVDKLITIPEVAKILSEKATGFEDFSKEAVKKADGNIGHLDAIARGIDQALSVKEKKEAEGLSLLKGLLSLKQLPKDTQELYGFFLHQIKNSPSVMDRSVRVRDESTGKDHFLSIWTEVYKRVLGVLSVAFEPLSIDQIQVLSGIVADRDDLIQVIEWLRQFLDQDGNRYRFYHGTVQEFLTSAKTRDRNEFTDLYVDPAGWHRRIAGFYWEAYQGDWSKFTDSYGLNNLARHLTEGGDHERLFSLISKEWMQARYRSGHNYLGFQTDVDLAWNATVDQKEPDLVRMVRLRSARCVTEEYEGFFADKDLETLLLLGRLSEALAHARMRNDPREKFEGLMTVFRYLTDGGQQGRAILDEAEEVAGKIHDKAKRAHALCELGAAFLATDVNHSNKLFNQAEDLSGKIDDASMQVHSLHELATKLALAGCPRDREVFLTSVRIACSITDDNSSTSLINFIISDLSSSGLLDRDGEVQQIIQGMKSTWARDVSLGYLANALCKLKRFVRAEGVIAVIERREEKVEALRYLATSLIQEHRKRAIDIFAKAEKIATTNPNPIAKTYELGALAADLAELDGPWSSQLFEKAFLTAGSIKEKWNKSFALRHLATNLTKAGRFAKAEEIVRSIRDPLLKSDLLRDAVSFLFKSGRLDEAKKTALSIPDPQIQITALQDIADNLLHQKRFHEAEEVIQNIQLEKFRAGSMKKLVEALAREGLLDQAIQTGRAIPIEKTRVEALRQLAGILARAGDSRVEEVLQSAVKGAVNQNLWRREETLRDLTLALAKAGHFDLAEKILPNIHSSRIKIETLCLLGTFLAQADDTRAHDVLNLARSVYEHEHVKALYAAAEELKRTGLLSDVENYVRDRRDDALLELSVAMARSGRFGQAEEFTGKISDKRRQAKALNNLAIELTRARKIDAERVVNLSKEVINSIPYSPTRSDLLREMPDGVTVPADRARAEAQRNLADTYAETGRYKEALSAIDSGSIDEVLGIISRWVMHFWQGNPSLSVAILAEAIGVAAWLHPAWEKIDRLLSGHEGK